MMQCGLQSIVHGDSFTKRGKMPTLQGRKRRKEKAETKGRSCHGEEGWRVDGEGS